MKLWEEDCTAKMVIGDMKKKTEIKQNIEDYHSRKLSWNRDFKQHIETAHHTPENMNPDVKTQQSKITRFKEKEDSMIRFFDNTSCQKKME